MQICHRKIDVSRSLEFDTQLCPDLHYSSSKKHTPLGVDKAFSQTALQQYSLQMIQLHSHNNKPGLQGYICKFINCACNDTYQPCITVFYFCNIRKLSNNVKRLLFAQTLQQMIGILMVQLFQFITLGFQTIYDDSEQLSVDFVFCATI